ncbi:lysophospholipase [Fredinandcohnia humi]
MNSLNTFFKASDGTKIYYKKWSDGNRETPKGIIQIAHGMAEHIERYEPFARVLVNEGYVVYGNDHRGHGKTGKEVNSIGFFADENGFDTVVNDMNQLTTILKNEYQSLPIFLFGHSMGSFLARRYIQLYGNQIKGLILSGTGGDPGFMGKIGTAIAKFEMRRKGKRTKSELMNKLTFGSYNKSFQPSRTEFDWLTRDEKEVDKYINDPLSGEIFSAGFYYDLLTGIRKIHDPMENKNIPATLPIYLIAGDKDPVGNNSKGVLQAGLLYQNLGVKDVTVKLYENGRHEILNEINKDEVYCDIVNWINDRI